MVFGKEKKRKTVESLDRISLKEKQDFAIQIPLKDIKVPTYLICSIFIKYSFTSLRA